MTTRLAIDDPTEFRARMQRVSYRAAHLAHAFKQMASAAEDSRMAFVELSAAIDGTIAEVVNGLHPSERIAYWFLVKVCRRYPLDTLGLLEEMRERTS